MAFIMRAFMKPSALALTLGSVGLGVLCGLCLFISPALAQPVKIGIAQFGRHPQLDAVVEAFKAELGELGFFEGEKVSYDYEQVNFDPSLVPQMLTKLKASGPKIILTITTPVSQAAKAALADSDVTAIFAAVTDPVAAKLTPSWQAGDEKMTGASDLQDIEGVLKFTRALLPAAKRLGVPYNPGEDNDIAVRDLLRQQAGNYGFEIVEVGVDNANDVGVRIAAFKDKADVIYVMTSNLLQPAEPAIAAAAEAIAVPIISASDANVKTHNVLASFSVSYAKVGANAASLAAKILEGAPARSLAPIKPAYSDHAPVISGQQLARYKLALTVELAQCNCVVP
jgi:putative tryptophan/tyrosine transport system substrate-binding protein